MSLTQEPRSAVPAVAAPTGFRKARRPLWHRWGFWFAVALVGCLAAGGGRYYYRNHQVASTLQASVDALDQADPGWRLRELEAARADLPDDGNAALCVEQVNELLAYQFEDTSLRISLQRLRPNERMWVEERDKLRADLQAKQPALARARELADLPHGRYPIAYGPNVLKIFLPHTDHAYHATILLCDDAQLRADDGDLRGALRSCRAALNAARSFGDEPFAVSQAARVRCLYDVGLAIERVLSQGEADPDDLRDLQILLAEEERFQRMPLMARSDRAELHALLAGVESGDVPLADFIRQYEQRSVRSRNTFFYSVAAVRADHPMMLRLATEAVEIARLPSPRERDEKAAAYAAKVKAGSADNLLFTFAPNFHWYDLVARRADSRLRCMIVAVAVERYRLLNGGWPESLGDLVLQDRLAGIPTDPATGEPFGYRRYKDRVVVYSRLVVPVVPPFAEAGPPRAFDPDALSNPGVGVAIHLFNVKYRHEQPGPKPPPAKVTGPSVGATAVP